MCTQTDRDLAILLGLNTYQGMTDSEIDTLMDYKIAMALASDETELKRSIMTATQNANIATNNQVMQRALNVLEYIRGLVQPLPEIEPPLTINNQNMEL